MKPVRLILCGWGPYRDRQSIDFEQMKERGLFLITGATGAGKTTVFDAMMYALYGCMSGEVREKGTVRSDFAQPETKTYVELIMTHKGETYQICRNPEYLRPSKRKSAGKNGMTKEKERAVLTMPDGTCIEGSSEVTRKIQELLRLDYRQFKQISMIAQGEFSRMLTASSSEKTKIFRQIFDTGLYERIAQTLKEESGTLYREVLQCRHKMDEDIEQYAPKEGTLPEYEALTAGTSYDYEAVTVCLKKERDRLKKETKDAEETLSKADEELLAVTAQLLKAQKLQAMFESLQAEQQKEQELFKRLPEMEERREKLSRAQQAQKIRQAEQLYEEALRQLELRDRQIAAMTEETETLSRLLAEKQTFYAQKEQIEGVFALKEELKRLQEESEHNIELCKQIEQQQKAQQTEYLAKEKEELSARTGYEEKELLYRHGAAGILAAGLVEEQPCPVCGSLHHPSPAEPEDTEVTGEEVEKLRKKWLALQKQTMELHGQVMAWRSRKTQAKEQAKELEEKERLLLAELAAYGEEVLSYTENSSREEFHKELRRIEELSVRLAEKREQLSKEEESRKTAKSLCEERSRETELLMIQCGFADRTEYERSCLEEQELERGLEELNEYQLSCSTNRELRRQLEKQLEGEEMPELAGLSEKQREVTGQKQQAQEHYSRCRGLFEHTQRTYSSLAEKGKKLHTLMERYSLVKGLDDAANGNNKKRLVFEQYVLISYFEEILQAANIRLARMSSGRFELRRQQGIGDARSKDNLEMEVLDYYTGRYRSVKTLSGGETFKVSLSLALGMSDVVQAQSGGIQVETMFIDEGFGALDGESLEQACRVLQGLSESNRLIGIISHVAELAEKIPDQLRIHKTNTGSTIEIVVS